MVVLRNPESYSIFDGSLEKLFLEREASVIVGSQTEEIMETTVLIMAVTTSYEVNEVWTSVAISWELNTLHNFENLTHRQHKSHEVTIFLPLSIVQTSSQHHNLICKV